MSEDNHELREAEKEVARHNSGVTGEDIAESIRNSDALKCIKEVYQITKEGIRDNAHWLALGGFCTGVLILDYIAKHYS